MQDAEAQYNMLVNFNDKIELGTVTPVNIKRVLAAKKGVCGKAFTLDSKQLEVISAVGILRGIDTRKVTAEFLFEDETGSMLVRYNSSEVGAITTHLQVDSYVKIYGHIVEEYGYRMVFVEKIVSLKDHNEISYHGLQVLHAYLSCAGRNCNGSSAVDTTKNLMQETEEKRVTFQTYKTSELQFNLQDKSANMCAQTTSKRKNADMIDPRSAKSWCDRDNMQSNEKSGILVCGNRREMSTDSLFSKIYAFISKSSVFEGAEFSEIQHSLGSEFEPSMIKSALDKLVESGVIYPIIDGLHFCAAYN
ncbi:hypothetical protein BB561_001171 [Smittium simulii]|uniref:Replication protein A C-terminal domain-containing protein n=1 Tax=Smittium simulii TaxID=133385 RepID=A0A2T9YVS6_9FUNG|nr:hypothetical protein BB561_001171 [Smittium simulii]